MNEQAIRYQHKQYQREDRLFKDFMLETNWVLGLMPQKAGINTSQYSWFQGRVSDYNDMM